MKLKNFFSKYKFFKIVLLILSVPLLFLFFIYFTFFLFFKFSGVSGFGPGMADYTYRINSFCEIGRNSEYDKYVQCGELKEIGPNIDKLGWNENFILVTTHPVTKRYYPYQPDNTYSVPDESITFWWIVDVKNKKLFGPLDTQDQFNQQIGILGIPKIELWNLDEAKDHATWVDGDFRDE